MPALIVHCSHPEAEGAERLAHELPEFLAVEATAGLPDYLAWLQSQTRHPHATETSA